MVEYSIPKLAKTKTVKASNFKSKFTIFLIGTRNFVEYHIKGATTFINKGEFEL